MKRNVFIVGHLGKLGQEIKKEFSANNYKVHSISNYKEYLLGYGFSAGEERDLPLSDSDFCDYLQQISRRGTYYNNIPALKNEFALSQYMCIQFLKSNKIDLVYFANIPHEGFDLVIERISRYLGIKVIITYQSIFNNRFFVFSDIVELGDTYFKRDYPRLTVESFSKQGLSYMKGVKGFASPVDVLSKRASDFSFRISKLLRNLMHLESFRHRALKILELSDDFVYKRNVKSLFNVQYDKLTTEYSYIYFPLHLQPELTTSALGRQFDDQVLAIENLSAILPHKYKIIVKENPKQTSRYRDKNWFQRIKTISNVVFVESSVSSDSLIKLSSVIATINGTAGWEAVMHGKPVIYFGTAWFKSFSNVIKFTHDLSIEKLIEERVSFDVDLELCRLSKTIPVGIVDQYYADNSEGICYLENAKLVVSSIIDYVNED